MDWEQKVFRYCERGGDPAFWAEPLNAISNAAFIIAALLATYAFMRRPPGERGIAEAALIAMTFVIGTGSFLFHTYATLWAAKADTIPIGIFMLAYFAYALRRFLSLPWIAVAICLGLFFWTLRYAAQIECRAGLFTVAANARHCLNGTMEYAPALIALLAIGAAMALRRHPAWPYVLGAGAVFLLSMVFRTIDWEACALMRMGGRAVGTHFLWHTLNGLALYLLLIGAIRYGRRRP